MSCNSKIRASTLVLNSSTSRIGTPLLEKKCQPPSTKQNLPSQKGQSEILTPQSYQNNLQNDPTTLHTNNTHNTSNNKLYTKICVHNKLDKKTNIYKQNPQLAHHNHHNCYNHPSNTNKIKNRQYTTPTPTHKTKTNTTPPKRKQQHKTQKNT